MQRTLLKFIPSLILVGGLFTSPLQLKRVLCVSTGKHISCCCCSHRCGGTFSDFISFQPNHQAQRTVIKTRQPLPLLMCILLASCPQGRRATEEVELGEVQCRMGVHQTPSACPCVCVQRQHWWWVRTRPVWGLHQMYGGVCVIQQRWGVCSSGLQGTGRELQAGRGAGAAPGQWDIRSVSGGSDAKRHRPMPAQSSGVQRENRSGKQDEKQRCVCQQRWKGQKAKL